MKLVAVSRGLTRRFEIGARQVDTAYLKAPTSEPVYVSASGLKGNETAVHPDAVYAIAAEHYEYWADYLKIDRDLWPYGYFAENLTIRGLDENDLRVGDLVRVGPQVALVVTGPRVPCFKVAWRMQQPERFVRDFARSGKTGVYFSVKSTGHIREGDAIEVLHRCPDNPTVREVSAYIQGERAATVEELTRILALPELSKTAAMLLSGALYRSLDAPDVARSWNGWKSFLVEAVRDEAADVKSFVLRPVERCELPRFGAGQFVTVRLPEAEGRIG